MPLPTRQVATRIPRFHLVVFWFYFAIKKNDTAYRINELEFESQMEPLLADAPELIGQMDKHDYS